MSRRRGCWRWWCWASCSRGWRRRSRRRPSRGRTSTGWRALGLAALAALSFGIGIFATGHISESLPVGWAVLPPRLVGVALVTIPLALSRRLRLTRAVLPLVVFTGLAEVFGFVCFAFGARESVAVAAVLGSQFGAVAAVAAFFFLRERLTRLQLTGVVLILVGVAALTWVTVG